MNKVYGIPDHLFNGTKPPGGLSWTLTTRTGEMLSELEERYGPRDKSWTLLGVEFYEHGPDIWYPGSHNSPHPKHIAIRLSPSAFGNYKEAIYQLSHECVHLLSPSGGLKAPVIEEGLAKLYSMELIERHFNHPSGQNYGSAPAYEYAADYVCQLLQIDSHAIRKLRDKEPAFYKITAVTFAQAGLSQVPEPLIDELLRTF
ncbi:hypothetical protein [Pantoea agglomerans]|uniref:hypothetical protein n=1 Tax=Enterobacter agglomerans TaxID=549 RepID=UPI0010C1FD56|nr:hypothetical protein [Pantoea agglomerans]MBD8145423.1 hypothetical protein [Pantoea agglomerans]MBD8184155.1 hypothetical protein [Pantoea agglomerans]MBD8223134.1 hypothetical protein [Pantoea agglomerans]TKJ54205.1 hypothetical protein PagCFBP13505_20610 [Pantoea agglomerans]WVL82598.1 hypothetical protein IFT78_021715 [Pantoea agglomerans]